MDTDFIGALAAILLAAIIGWAEKYFGKKKHTKEASHQANQPLMPLTKKASAAARKNTVPPASTSQAPKPFLATAEGSYSPYKSTISTQQPAFAATDAEKPGLRPLDRAGLRNAIIWGEILKPKY